MRYGFHFHYTEILSPSRFGRHPDVPPHRFLISLDRFSGNPFSLAFSLNVPPHAVAFPTSGSSIWKPGIPFLFPPAYDLPVYILLSFFDISLDSSCFYSTIHFECFQLRLLYCTILAILHMSRLRKQRDAQSHPLNGRLMRQSKN